MRLLVFFCCLLALPAVLPAQQPGDDSSSAKEIDQLKKRVAELEDQNRQILLLLQKLQARLGDASTTTTASAAVGAQPTGSQGGADGSAKYRDNAAPLKAATQPPAVLWRDLMDDGSRIRLYGMLRVDMDLSTQRPNNTQSPLFITSPSAGRGGSFTMHPRLTRFGVNLNGPRIDALGNAELSGNLETDFQNGGSESRQIIRIRQAYLKAKWGSFSVLGGQTWDIFSPLFPTVNNDTLMWTAGNVGDRRPQLRAAYEPQVGEGQFSFAAGIGLAGAIDALDLDGNGYRDGEQSSRPNIQSRAGYSRTLWLPRRPFSFGVSFFSGWEKSTRLIGGRTLLPSEGYNIDYTLPLTAMLTMRGEGWWGRNMSDFRGGAGQGITLANGRLVRSRGGWSEVKIQVSRYWAFVPGFTTDNPVAADLAAGSRTRNRAAYIGTRFTPGNRVEIGLDYLRWRTDYRAQLTGFDNRFNLFLQYGF